MTITHGILTIFLPVTLSTAALALIHKHGFGRFLRAIAAALWAMSYAWPAAIRALRHVYLEYWRRTMEMA